MPVIGHNVGQVAEVIRDGHNGLLCNGTAEDLVAHICHLKDNPDVRRRMGARARETVEQFYNWERVAQQTDGVLRQVMRR